MTPQNSCIAKARALTKPDFWFWVLGAVKIRKTPYFRRVFLGFFAYNTGVPLPIYFKKGAKCVYKQAACNFEADNFCGGSGGRKNRKHPIFHVFGHKNAICINIFVSQPIIMVAWGLNSPQKKAWTWTGTWWGCGQAHMAWTGPPMVNLRNPNSHTQKIIQSHTCVEQGYIFYRIISIFSPPPFAEGLFCPPFTDNFAVFSGG